MESSILDLYEGNSINIWMDQEDEHISLSIHNGQVTIAIDSEDFKELCNAIFIAKQTLKDRESQK